MAQAQGTDIRRYISTVAAPGEQFAVKVAGGIEIARGTWRTVDASSLGATVKGEVPWWVPHFGGKPFEVTLSIKLLGGNEAEVSISGSASGSSKGTFTTSGDEMKIVGLKFAAPLDTIHEVSLTRWYQVETRASFYRVPYTNFWFECWWTPVKGADATKSDYPPPRVPEGVDP